VSLSSAAVTVVFVGMVSLQESRKAGRPLSIYAEARHYRGHAGTAQNTTPDG